LPFSESCPDFLFLLSRKVHLFALKITNHGFDDAPDFYTFCSTWPLFHTPRLMRLHAICWQAHIFTREVVKKACLLTEIVTHHRGNATADD